MIEDKSHRTGTDLRRKLVRRLACHSPILSGVGASGKPGAVQSRTSSPVKRLQERPRRRLGRSQEPDDGLVAAIKAVIAELPTYAYRRVHTILKRQALAEGRQPPNSSAARRES